MKIYETTHKDISYRFELFESVDKVEVLKNGVHTYSIHKLKSGWKCNCWGAVRHKRCWHVLEALPMLLLTPSCQEPWCEWAEDAIVLNQQLHTNEATVR